MCRSSAAAVSSFFRSIIFFTFITAIPPRPPCWRNSSLSTAPWWFTTNAVLRSSLMTMFAGSPSSLPSSRSSAVFDRLTIAFGVPSFSGRSAFWRSMAYMRGSRRPVARMKVLSRSAKASPARQSSRLPPATSPHRMFMVIPLWG